MTGKITNVIIVATVKPQEIAMASPRQKSLGNMGINPNTVVRAVSMIGRNRTITDSVTAFSLGIPCARCWSIWSTSTVPLRIMVPTNAIAPTSTYTPSMVGVMSADPEERNERAKHTPAMRIGMPEDRIVMGFWDCPYCDKKEIQGTLRNCPGCGRPRGDTKCYMKSRNHEEVVRNGHYLTEEQAKTKGKGADWICAYCDCSNSVLN